MSKWSLMQKDKAERSAVSIIFWEVGCLYEWYLTRLNSATFAVGQVVNVTKREEASADYSGVLQRQQSPFGASHSHVILEKSTSAGPELGLQENRVQTRSNSLLLRAAKETVCSQSVHESTVDFIPWNLNRQQEANPPPFLFFFPIRSQNNTCFLALVSYFPSVARH